jgi:adenine deaminase
MKLRKLIEVARGDRQADLVVSGKIFSVFTGEIIEGDVAVCDSYIAGIGKKGSYTGERIEASGYILPGFIDAHLHLESTLLSPTEFVKAVLPHGTTAVVIDPHEIANVAGRAGVEYLINATKELPITFYITAPSCVPAIKGLETFGYELTANDIASIMENEGVVGLAEVMNFPGVVDGEEETLRKVEVSSRANGHAPGLTDKALNAYIAAGICSDHECSTIEEVLEKVRLGMRIMLREGSVAKNLYLTKAVNDFNAENFMLASDDLLPVDIEEGHMDYRLKLCVEHGVKPEIAVKMATINTARYFGLPLGAIAPGYKADVVVVDDLTSFNVRLVVKEGKVAWDGKLRAEIRGIKPPDWIRRSVKMVEIKKEDLVIRAKGKLCRLIEIVPGQIVTRKTKWEPLIINGIAFPDSKQDVAKVAVVDRHRMERRIGLGFVRGFGIKKGALASSIAHDSHNCICIGMNDLDMLKALKRVKDMQGGLVVVDEEVKAELPLPIAGLMSDLPFEEVVGRLKKLYREAMLLGIRIQHPFTTLSFLALPVIPELKITNYGLVDVKKMKIVDLWVV